MNLLNKLFTKKDEDNFNYIFAPVAGEAIALTEVPDAAFAAGELGNGIGIIPTDGHVYAPANGTVTSFTVKPGDTVTEGQTLAYIG
jgi:phosphotransferase system IIA component